MSQRNMTKNGLALLLVSSHCVCCHAAKCPWVIAQRHGIVLRSNQAATVVQQNANGSSHKDKGDGYIRDQAATKPEDAAAEAAEAALPWPCLK